MRTLPFVALLTVAVLLVYGPGLQAPLVFDDHDAITANPSIRSPWTALSPPPETPVAGRPLPNLSFALSYALFGLAPGGYRALGFLAHVLNAWLSFVLVRALLRRPVVAEALRERANGIAQTSALLWLVHPLASEAVMYVTQRTEQLAATLYLLTLVCAVKALEPEQVARARTWTLLAAVACLLGTQCKETIVSAPLAVLLIDRGFFAPDLRTAWRARRGLYLGLAVSWLALALVLAASPRGRTAGLHLGVSPLESLATQGSVITHYLKLAALPHPLSISYDWRLAEPLHRYLIEDLSVALLFGAGLVVLVKRPWMALPWLVFFGVLAPSSSVVPVLGELAAERRMYLPLLALVVLVVSGAALLVERFSRAERRARVARIAPYVVTATLALAYAATTAARVHDYRSEEALWRQTLRHQPDNPIAIWGLGDALGKQGRRAEALALYERMARGARPYRGPFSWGTRGLLAASQLHARAGDQVLATRTLRRAFAHEPASAVGTLYRAALLRHEGKPREALRLVEQVLAGPHLHAEAHLLAGNLLRELGDEPRAQQHLAEAQRLDHTGAALALMRQLVALPKQPR
jgi:tetratricopeptide (TPR) repeat protein